MANVLPWLIYVPFFWTLYLFTKQLLNKLQNRPPSPFLSLPILGHLHLAKKHLFRSLADVSQRYGPVVLLHFGYRPVLVISSAEAAEECFTRNDLAFANRPKILAAKHIGNNYSSMAWSSYGDHWRHLKRISLTEILSSQKLEMLRHIRVHEMRTVMKGLERAAREGRPVDMKKIYFDLTSNQIMRMISGKRYYGENAEDSEAAKRFRDLTTETLLRSTANIGDFLPVLKWFDIEKPLRELQSRRTVFLQELVDECRERLASYQKEAAEGKQRTMIEMLLTLQQKEPEYYTDSLIRSLMMVMLIAATDTSAGTMEWTMCLLLNHPQVLKKAQAEIDSCVGHDRFIEESDVANLPYLHSIINETLRLYPAAPLLIPHESGKECVVGGYSVPAGTMLLVNIWAIQNDPKNFEDVSAFRPERFEGLQGNRDGFKFMPFGSGRRACPGEGLAVRVVGFAIGTLLQCFDWDRVEGKELVDMTEDTGLTLFKKIPLTAACKVRPVAEKLLSQI